MLKNALFYILLPCLFFKGLAIASADDDVFKNSSEITPKLNFSEILDKANQFFDAALYEKSIPLYQILFKASNERDYIEKEPFIRYRLSQALFLSGDNSNAVALLKDTQKIKLTQLETYLLALSYEQLSQTKEAIDLLKSILTSDTDPNFNLIDDTRFELAKLEYEQENFLESQELLKKVLSETKSARLKTLSKFYLARISLAREEFDNAESYLKDLSKTILSDDLFKYELAYLYGEMFFQQENYEEAARYFSQSLPERNGHKLDWYEDSLYQLGWSFLKASLKNNQSLDDQRLSIENAEETWKKLFEFNPQEKVLLALGQCYLTKARMLNDERGYVEAEEILTRQDILLSREAQAHALLLRAQATSSYEGRESLYRHLTHETHQDTPYYAKGWYLRGLNDFEEGVRLLAENAEETNLAFEHAANSLKEAFKLLKKSDLALAGQAVKYQAKAIFFQKSNDKSLLALSLLKEFIADNENILNSMDDPDEIFFLFGKIAAQNTQWNEAEKALDMGLKLYPNGKFSDEILLLQGILNYSQQKFDRAEMTFLKLVSGFPLSSLAGDALFWVARCADCTQDPKKSKKYKQQVFEQHPQSTFAAEAYFSYYDYQEYLQGDRTAVKHLQEFPDKFSETPLLVHAWYLMGMDYKRDRKSPEGKWICKKSLSSAIDAFQEAESAFDDLYQKAKIPDQELSYLTTIRYRAMLERGLANLNIADESQGAKKQIYLEYAQELFCDFYADFNNDQHPLHNILNNNENCLQIKREGAYWLSQAYVKDNNDLEAEKVLSEILENYRSEKITRGYFLSRAWYEQGLIEMRRKEYVLANQCFMRSEDASKGKILNTDQKLDLWIQQSYCQMGLKDFDAAILLLSKAINDDAISGLRIKAMYLRAELSEMQDRREVARRQFEATSKKGGEWALKAKEKLEKEYGYK